MRKHREREEGAVLAGGGMMGATRNETVFNEHQSVVVETTVEGALLLSMFSGDQEVCLLLTPAEARRIAVHLKAAANVVDTIDEERSEK